VPHFCSYHILTSSVIYYWTDARQHGIYFLIIAFKSKCCCSKRGLCRTSTVVGHAMLVENDAWLREAMYVTKTVNFRSLRGKNFPDRFRFSQAIKMLSLAIWCELFLTVIKAIVLRLRSFGVIQIRISDPRSVWIIVHQRNRRIHSGHEFTGSFYAPWSRQILDHWYGSGSPQRNAAED